MDPPPADNPLPVYDFFSEFLPVVEFGESFRFEGFFDFGVGAFAAGDSSFSGGLPPTPTLRCRQAAATATVTYVLIVVVITVIVAVIVAVAAATFS